jgi:transcriptional regulator with XRE-family HTH domain
MYYETFEKLCNEKNIRPSQISRATGIATATFTEWKKGTYTPKTEKLQLIADYFGVSLDFLMTGKDIEKKSEEGTSYYFNDETAKIAQQLFEDKDMRLLFDAARDSKPENLQMAAEMLKRFKETNPNG